MATSNFKTGHELAALLLSLPDVSVTAIQHYGGQFSGISAISYSAAQDHSSGDLVTDEEGKVEYLIRLS